LLGKEYAVSSDVWSLGLSLIELATGHFPIPADGIENLVVLRSPSAPLPTDERKSNMSVFELLGHIVEGEAPRLPAAFSNEFRDFVAKCLVKDPSARPSMANLLEHPWITAAASQPIDMAEWAKGTLPFGRDESLRPRPASQAPFDSLI
jgi:serine/threonine protein kinase